YPRVFVHLAAEEAGAVGSLLPDDLSALDESIVVNQQRPAFSARDVFCFVETLRCKAAKGTEELAAILAEKSMSVVLDHGQVVLASNLQDRVHFTSDAGVVQGHDRARVPGNQVRQFFFVEIERVRPHIGEDWTCTAEDEGVSRGNKAEGGHNNFVSLFQIQEQCCHFKCVCAGGRQQGLAHS